jgi:transposase-like protein
MAEAGENRRVRGRPTALTSEAVAAILAAIASGKTLDDAAHAAGVDPSTLRRWRRRAWNPEPSARRAVELEQAIVRTKLALLDHRPRREPMTWEGLMVELDANWHDLGLD